MRGAAAAVLLLLLLALGGAAAAAAAVRVHEEVITALNASALAAGQRLPLGLLPAALLRCDAALRPASSAASAAADESSSAAAAALPAWAAATDLGALCRVRFVGDFAARGNDLFCAWAGATRLLGRWTGARGGTAVLPWRLELVHAHANRESGVPRLFAADGTDLASAPPSASASAAFAAAEEPLPGAASNSTAACAPWYGGAAGGLSPDAYLFDAVVRASDAAALQTANASSSASSSSSSSSASYQDPIVALRTLVLSAGRGGVAAGAVRVRVVDDLAPAQRGAAVVRPAVKLEYVDVRDSVSSGRGGTPPLVGGAGAHVALVPDSGSSSSSDEAAADAAAADAAAVDEADGGAGAEAEARRSAVEVPTTGLVVFQGTTFQGNLAGSGGALAVMGHEGAGNSRTAFSKHSPWVYLAECVMKLNTAVNRGLPNSAGTGGAIFVMAGGAYVAANALLFENNTAFGGGGGGAYVRNSGRLVLSGASFNYNSGARGGPGGGVMVASGGAFVCQDGCTMMGNVGRAGGAIFAEGRGFVNVSSSPAVHPSAGALFRDNHATDGGAVRAMTESKVHLLNVVFSGNEAFRFGGAIHADSNARVEMKGADLKIAGNNTADTDKGSAAVFCANAKFDVSANVADQFALPASAPGGNAPFTCALIPACTQCKVTVPSGSADPCETTYAGGRGCSNVPTDGVLANSPLLVALIVVVAALVGICLCLTVMVARHRKKTRGDAARARRGVHLQDLDHDDHDMGDGLGPQGSAFDHDDGLHLLVDDFDDDPTAISADDLRPSPAPASFTNGGSAATAAAGDEDAAAGDLTASDLNLHGDAGVF